MLKPGEVEVRVEAIGLNFRDVLNAPWFGECHGWARKAWLRGYSKRDDSRLETAWWWFCVEARAENRQAKVKAVKPIGQLACRHTATTFVKSVANP